jgi:hypothetical protein
MPNRFSSEKGHLLTWPPLPLRQCLLRCLTPLVFASLIWFVEQDTTASARVISLSHLIEANPQLATI